MHEMSIAESIIQIILEESNSQIVKEVYLKVSRLEHIVPDSLIFYYDIIKEDFKNLKNSVLLVEFESLIGKCFNCGNSYNLEDIFFLCPKCNSGLEIIKGKETYIEKILIET